jgi:glycosyltransferase involved in cell wall biosynthesis
MNLCLNMIVKNEGARILRALASAAPYINSWVIVDTGSTDDTKQKIRDFFLEKGIPGEIRDEPFIDWEQARNAALKWAQDLAFAYQPDYILLMDADMELRVRDASKFPGELGGLAYEMYQQAGGVVYTNARLLRAGYPGRYRGVTHEYLDVPSSGCIPPDVADFLDHADGANRPEKFKRDIRLLKGGLKREPNNARYMFYLANSYRDAGKPEDAAKWFKRRIEAGGWDEEVWNAHVNLAHSYRDCNRENDFVGELWKAYCRRPSRAEPLYDLAKYHREKPDQQAAGWAAASIGVDMPMPADKLFVNSYVYTDGFKDELAILGFYVPGKRMEGYYYAAEQALSFNSSSRAAARGHLYHYVKPLADFCPSFKWASIKFTPPEGWAALNPSVAMHATALYVNVRCVNYRMDEEGRYLIRNTETGEVTNDNPINTRNFVCYLGNSPFNDADTINYEVKAPPDLPVKFPLVIGFEDTRLYPIKSEMAGEQLWASSTTRQMTEDGIPDQTLSYIRPVKSLKRIGEHTLIARMERENRVCEKNWAPILNDDMVWMYKPGHVVDSNALDIVKHEPPCYVDDLRGSSQVVGWPGGKWLAITHEASHQPGSPWKRWYMHRFVEYDADFKVSRISLPFVFNDRVIEFCAGMTWHPNGTELVVSYGYKDEEARIATVSVNEVENLLCSKNW